MRPTRSGLMDMPSPTCVRPFRSGDRLINCGRVENAFDANYVQVANCNSYRRNAHVGVRATF